MHFALAAIFGFAILTLWVPSYWPISVFQVSIFVLTGLLAWRERHSTLRFAFPAAALSFAVLWGVIQWLSGHTVYAFETKRAIVHWSTLLAVFLTASCLFREVRVRHWFASAMLWFSFGVAVLATFQVFTSKGLVFWIFPSGYPDVMGPILSPNHFAAFAEVVLPIALVEALRRSRDVLLYSTVPAALYASTLASGSRAGFILTSTEVALVVLLMWWRGRTSGLVLGRSALNASLVIVVLGTVLGWQTVRSRLMMPDPTNERRAFIQSSLHMIRDHPWFGVGLGTWPTRYPQYAVFDSGLLANQAHSDWFQWTAEAGLPFGAAMLCLFRWCLRPAFRTIWGLGVVAVFLHAAVDYPFSRPALACWPILVMAMMAAAGSTPSSVALVPTTSVDCKELARRV